MLLLLSIMPLIVTEVLEHPVDTMIASPAEVAVPTGIVCVVDVLGVLAPM